MQMLTKINHMNIKLFFVSLLSLIFLVAKTQDSIPGIKVISKVESKKIILRWAPTTDVAWHLNKPLGYKIERATNNVDSDKFNTFKVIAEVKPWPKSNWTAEKLSDYDKYCIVAAELLYGHQSNLNENSKIIQRADEYSNKYNMAMMSADFSSQAADALGLRYEDKDIEPGKVYIYRISSQTNLDYYKIQPGGAVAYSSVLDTLFAPQINQIYGGDRINLIKWKKEGDDMKYTAFYIERSEDNITYSRLNKAPYISSNELRIELFKSYHVYIDSVDQNYKPYWYRICGVSPFGETSPYSDPFWSLARDMTPPTKPDQVRSIQINQRSVKLLWNFPEEENGSTAGFYIGRSSNVQDNFENITPVILDPNIREFTDTSANPLVPNFYIVTAIDTAGNYNISISHYAHLVDSVPPSPPVGFTGFIDSSGLVFLSWTPNHEADIMGYSIHFSNHKDHVFANVSNNIIRSNEYVDTIMQKSLTEEIFYKIVAVDKNYNYSDFSPVLALKKPDQIPPSFALINQYKVYEKYVKISWINSTSSDVKKHVLYRMAKAEPNVWTKVFETDNKNITSFEDADVKPKTTYFYKINAVDDAHLESKDGNLVEIISKPEANESYIVNLKATRENDRVILNWDTIQNVKKYLIYKTNKDGKFILLDALKENIAIDKNPHTWCEYAMRIISLDGVYSDFSKPVSISNQ